MKWPDVFGRRRIATLEDKIELYREIVADLRIAKAERDLLLAEKAERQADADRAERVAVAASRVFDRLSNEIRTRLSLDMDDVDEHAAVVHATHAHPLLPAALELAHEVDRNPQFHRTAEADLLLRLVEFVAPPDPLRDAVDQLF